MKITDSRSIQFEKMNTRSSLRLALRSSSIEFRNQTSRGSIRRNKSKIISSDSDSDEDQVKLQTRTFRGSIRSKTKSVTSDCDSDEEELKHSQKAREKMEKQSSRLSVRKSKVYSDSDSEEEKTKPKKVDILKTPRKTKATDKYLEEQSPVTPPKQRKSHDTNLSTPNHNRDITTNLNTPSSLLRKLVLTSPDKNSICSNRKSLFLGNDSIKEKANTDVFQNARRALHSTAPTDMPGREKELEELRGFISDHLTNKTSGSMYISGPPGTGKTASLNLMLKDENVSIMYNNSKNEV